MNPKLSASVLAAALTLVGPATSYSQNTATGGSGTGAAVNAGSGGASTNPLAAQPGGPNTGTGAVGSGSGAIGSGGSSFGSGRAFGGTGNVDPSVSRQNPQLNNDASVEPRGFDASTNRWYGRDVGGTAQPFGGNPGMFSRGPTTGTTATARFGRPSQPLRGTPNNAPQTSSSMFRAGGTTVGGVNTPNNRITQPRAVGDPTLFGGLGGAGRTVNNPFNAPAILTAPLAPGVVVADTAPTTEVTPLAPITPVAPLASGSAVAPLMGSNATSTPLPLPPAGANTAAAANVGAAVNAADARAAALGESQFSADLPRASATAYPPNWSGRTSTSTSVAARTGSPEAVNNAAATSGSSTTTTLPTARDAVEIPTGSGSPYTAGYRGDLSSDNRALFRSVYDSQPYTYWQGYFWRFNRGAGWFYWDGNRWIAFQQAAR